MVQISTPQAGEPVATQRPAATPTVILRLRARGHRRGCGLVHLGPGNDTDYVWAECKKHKACRGQLYRRDLWMLQRIGRGPADFELCLLINPRDRALRRHLA